MVGSGSLFEVSNHVELWRVIVQCSSFTHSSPVSTWLPFSRYALLCKPSEASEWTDELRTSFLKGFMSMLDLLKMMQVIWHMA